MRAHQTLKQLGPGLLYAGAAVGVSHLVQSTRAGAQFGYALIWVIVLAHLVKYPFFLMGPYFSKHTGTHILHGYKKIGTWALWLFNVLTLASMFAVIAAISVVTAGLAENIFNIHIEIRIWTSLLLIICFIILVVGRYALLDRLIKWVILLLTFTTIIAFVLSLTMGSQPNEQLSLNFNWGEKSHLLFLIAFIGWMPAPMDISIWHSVWQIEKDKNQKVVDHGNKDFNIGFIGTGLLAMIFLALGASAFYGSEIELASGGIKFSAQLINLYQNIMGNWAYWVIAIAAFTTMFSTIITCYDAFPRVLTESIVLLKPNWIDKKTPVNISLLLILGAGAQYIVYFKMENMKQMVDFATSVSFLTTPLLALLNYLAIKKAAEYSGLRFPKTLDTWSKISLLILLSFAIWYATFIW